MVEKDVLFEYHLTIEPVLFKSMSIKKSCVAEPLLTSNLQSCVAEPLLTSNLQSCVAEPLLTSNLQSQNPLLKSSSSVVVLEYRH